MLKIRWAAGGKKGSIKVMVVKDFLQKITSFLKGHIFSLSFWVKNPTFINFAIRTTFLDESELIRNLFWVFLWVFLSGSVVMALGCLSRPGSKTRKHQTGIWNKEPHCTVHVYVLNLFLKIAFKFAQSWFIICKQVVVVFLHSANKIAFLQPSLTEPVPRYKRISENHWEFQHPEMPQSALSLLPSMFTHHIWYLNDPSLKKMRNLKFRLLLSVHRVSSYWREPNWYK